MLFRSRLQYYSRRVKFLILEDDAEVHPTTYFRIAQHQSSALFPSLRHLLYDLGDPSYPDPHIFFFQSPLLDSLEILNIGGFEHTIVGPFLASLSSQVLSHISLSCGRMPRDILKKSIVHWHFKQLRSLELTDAILLTDFTILEVIGSLPSLTHFSLTALDFVSHPTEKSPEISTRQSGGSKYFDALESLYVMGTIFLIQNLLGFIDSLCLKSIEIYPLIDDIRHEHELEVILTPSMTIVASKWSQSLKNLAIRRTRIDSDRSVPIYQCLMPLTGLHEMESFHLEYWTMKNMDDVMRRLVMSWPKLRTLIVNVCQRPHDQPLISLSTLWIIVENCPELRHLEIPLDTSTIPPSDTSNSKSLRHNLEVLTAWGHKDLDEPPSDTITTQEMLGYQIQVARYLDLIFPFLKSIEVEFDDVTWSGIPVLVKLCQDARRVN